MILMSFTASADFCFACTTLAKHILLRTMFIWGNKKKSFGRDGVEREGGARESCSFCSETAEHSVQCGQVCSQVTHHKMGKHIERVFKQNSLKRDAPSHNSASWHIDTDGFLEHSPSRGSLYYKAPTPRRRQFGYFGSPLIYI